MSRLNSFRYLLLVGGTPKFYIHMRELRSLLPYMRRYRSTYLFGLLFVVVSNILTTLGPRFLERDGVEQDRGVRHRPRAAFQLGETAAGADGGFQNRRCFEMRRGWEEREVVVRFGAVKCGHAVDV